MGWMVGWIMGNGEKEDRDWEEEVRTWAESLWGWRDDEGRSGKRRAGSSFEGVWEGGLRR